MASTYFWRLLSCCKVPGFEGKARNSIFQFGLIHRVIPNLHLTIHHGGAMRYHCQIHLSAAVLLLALGISHSLLATISKAATTSGADDRTIMAAFIQDNQFDVDMATIAIKRSVRKDVKDLAEMIVRDHAQIGLRAKALRATLGWKRASQGPAAILPSREKVLEELQAATPHDFDDLYLQHERDFSKGFVHAMKTQWFPTAQHPQFKAFLTSVTKQLDEHMAHMSHIGGIPDPHNHGH